MKACVGNLKQHAHNLLEVVNEAYRLEAVNESFFLENQEKRTQLLKLREEIESKDKTINLLFNMKKAMKELLESFCDEVITSDNLITLRDSFEIHKSKLNNIYELHQELV